MQRLHVLFGCDHIFRWFSWRTRCYRINAIWHISTCVSHICTRVNNIIIIAIAQLMMIKLTLNFMPLKQFFCIWITIKMSCCLNTSVLKSNKSNFNILKNKGIFSEDNVLCRDRPMTIPSPLRSKRQTFRQRPLIYDA
jgi:hypothetical protein